MDLMKRCPQLNNQSIDEQENVLLWSKQSIAPKVIENRLCKKALISAMKITVM